MNPRRREEQDSTTPRPAVERDSNDDIGYKIRGAAQISDSSVIRQPREESPARYHHQDHRYRESDGPSWRRSSTDYYYDQRSDDYDRHSARSDRPDSYRPGGYGRHGSRNRDYRDWDNDNGYRNYRDRSYHTRGHDQYERSRAHFSQGYGDSESDPYSEPYQAPDNTGEGDVSQDGFPVSVLILRGLKSNTTEELLAKGMEKLYRDGSEQVQHDASTPPGAPPGITASALAKIPGAANLAKPAAMPAAPPGTLKRVFLIRDRETDKPMQYGFAEYHTVSDSKAALAKAELLGDKFTISSKKIEAFYMDRGCFPLVMNPLSEDPRHTVQFMTGQHKYRDERYYASPLVVNPEPPVPPTSADSQKSKTTKKRPNEATGVETLDGNSEKIKKPKTSATIQLAQAQAWTQKQQELRGEDGGADENEESSTRPSSPSSANHGSVVEKEFMPQSYIYEGPVPTDDQQHWFCFLCGRQFPGNNSLEEHANESPLHAQNLGQEEVRNKALERMKKWGVQEDATKKMRIPAPKQTEKAVYRDRAKERRVLEAKAAAPAKLKVSLKDAGKKKGGPVEKPGDEKPSGPSYGKGQTMLEKSGWRNGMGLGNGEGITAPIEQFTYAAGVGLGHEGGKKGGAVEEANRATKADSGSFLEKTKDVARARFERV